MSLVTHTAEKPKHVAKPISAKAAAQVKALKAREAGKAERQHIRQTASRRSGRLGDLSGRELSTANLTSMCQVAIVRSGKSFTRIGEEQGLNPRTVSNLLYGRTKRVSAATMLAALAAADISLELKEAH